MNKSATLDNGITREDGRYALPSTTLIDLPKGYRPSNNEEYMNPKHLAYFRNMQALVADSSPSECVVLFNTELFALDEPVQA